MVYRYTLICGWLILLSGCTLTSQHQHKETLNTIHSTATHVHEQQTATQNQLKAHDNTLTVLTDEMRQLADKVNVMQRTQAKMYANFANPKPEVKIQEKVVRVPVNNDKVVLGGREWVWFDEVKSTFQSRVDTGAATSSLNAVDIQEFERDGDTWVKFNVNHSEKNDQSVFMEMPVKRWVLIRQSSTDKTDRRPVVEAWIRVGNIHEKTEFTLADRTNMEYPVLLGRSFFKDLAVVDVSQVHVHPQHQPDTPSEPSDDDTSQQSTSKEPVQKEKESAQQKPALEE